jgi:transmembrane sensor
LLGVRHRHRHPKLDLDLLGRYLEGSASPAETEAVERWIEADSRRREGLEQLRWLWHTEGYARTPKFDAGRAWARMPTWVRAGLRPPRTSVPAWSATRRLIQAGVAAAVLLAVGLGLWFVRQGAPPEPPEVAYVTQRGELRSFTLDDGTRVFLGAASRLSAPRKFGAERGVTLDGEAYFDVVHDAARPFRVRASGMVVEDIGTSFSVRAFPHSTVREIAVRTGKVAVSPAIARQPDSTRGPTLLTPGMLLRMSGGRLTVARADTSSYFGWTTGRLVFIDQPLGEVIEAVERWFKLTVVLDDPALAEGRVTATFGPQSQGKIAAMLGELVGARVEQRGDTAYLRTAGGAVDTGRSKARAGVR